LNHATAHCEVQSLWWHCMI